MNASYRYLIEAYCSLCRIENPGRIMDGGSIIVDGVTFSLIHSETVNPGVMFIYCDFGDAPMGRQADVYKALLEANLFLYTGSGPAFAVSDETGRVLLVDQYPLSAKPAPEELHRVLSQLAAMATEWRIDHILDKQSRAAGAASRRIPGLAWARNG